MEKLKVGDRVVVVKTDFYKNVPIGTKAIVSSFINNIPRIKVGESDYQWCMGEKELKKIEENIESQNKQILNYLLTGATINPITALELFGSFRLSARIHDLKGQGHNIKTTMVYNGKKKWANYNLIQ